MNPLVSIIIPNYNGERFLENCLKTVLKSKYQNFEVLIRDDGSRDRSEEIIRSFLKKDKRIKFSKNKNNMGAAATRNLAVKSAKGELLVFLDNDTEVKSDWLNYMIDTLIKDQTTGATMAKIKDMNHRDMIQTAGGKLWRATGWSIYNAQMKKDSKKWDKTEKIAPISAALMVKKSIFDSVRGFDEKEAVYTEDLDFGWRVWIQGHQIVFCPKSVVYHFSKTVSDRKMMNVNYKHVYFHLAKNSFRSMLKNYELKNIIRFLPESIFINLARALLVLIKRKDISALQATLEAIFWNIKNIRDTLEKRRYIQGLRQFSDDKLFSLIFAPENSWEIYKKHFKQTRLL